MSATHSVIRKNLANKFIFSEKFAREATLAILAQLHPLWHGPGGLGKTEMILAVLESFEVEYGVLECHPDTSVSDLFGGAVARTEIRKFGSDSHIDAEEVTKADIYYERGLLNKPHFFLEEVLDAPLPVLSALKAVITNGVWDGRQSQNELIVGATNLNPFNLLEEVPPNYRNSFEALFQRFLIMGHSWPTIEDMSFRQKDYLKLLQFNPQPHFIEVIDNALLEEEKEMVKMVTVSNEILNILAELAHRSTDSGHFVSPRTLIWTTRLLKASAFVAGRSTVTLDDFSVLEMVGSFNSSVAKDIDRMVKDQQIRQKYAAENMEFINKLDKLKNAWDKPMNKHFLALSIAKAYTLVRDEINEWATNDEFKRHKCRLLEVCDNEIQKAEAVASEEVVYVELLD